jgi:MinD superfamily P-loop ATPase
MEMVRVDIDDASVPLIDVQACTCCGLCVERCPEDVVALLSGRLVLVRPEACTYCGVCESVCPADAIALPYLIIWDDSVDAERASS